MVQLLVVCATVGGTVGATARFRTWTSDDVAVQLALRTWRPGSSTLYWPESTWLVRAPLYLATDAVIGSGRNALVLQALVLNLVAFVLIWWALRRVLDAVARSATPTASATPTDPTDPTGRRGWLATVTTCWLVTMSPTFVQGQLAVNGRSVEIGLVAAVVVWCARRFAPAPDGVAPLRSAIVPGLVLALLAVDDATIVYAVVVPALALSAVAWLLGRNGTSALVAVAALIGLAGWRIGLRVLRIVGVTSIPLDVRLARADEYPTTVSNAVESLSRLFDAGVLGSAVRDVRFLVVGPQLLALALGAVLLIRRRRMLAAIPEVAALVVWAGGLLAAFVLSSHGLTIANIRYVAYALAALAMLIGVALVCAPTRARRAIAVALTLVTVVHVVDLGRSVRDDSGAPNAAAARVVEALHAVGISRGYGDFWETLGPSYLGGDSLELVPVGCVEGRTAARRWFIDDAIDEPRTAGGSAFVYNTRDGLQTCSLDAIVAQFGEPLERRTVTPEITLLVYGRDIGAEFAAPLPPG